MQQQPLQPLAEYVPALAVSKQCVALGNTPDDAKVTPAGEDPPADHQAAQPVNKE